MKKTHSYKRRNIIHHYYEVKEKLYNNSFIYVSAIVEQHQVQAMYASQKVQVSSILREPKTHFRHVQGGQRCSAITSSINNIQNTNNTAHEIEPKKKVNKKTLKMD